MAYNHLTGSNLTAYKKVDKGVKYIDEYQEIASAFVMIKNRKLTLSSWIRSLMGSKTFRFMNKDDIYPFIYSIIFMLKRFVNMDFYG